MSARLAAALRRWFDNAAEAGAAMRDLLRRQGVSGA